MQFHNKLTFCLFVRTEFRERNGHLARFSPGDLVVWHISLQFVPDRLVRPELTLTLTIC